MAVIRLGGIQTEMRPNLQRRVERLVNRCSVLICGRLIVALSVECVGLLEVIEGTLPIQTNNGEDGCGEQSSHARSLEPVYPSRRARDYSLRKRSTTVARSGGCSCIG